MRKSVLVLSGLVLGLGLLGACSKPTQTPSTMMDMSHVDMSKINFMPQTMNSPEAKMGEHVVCPVSGEKIMVTEKTPFAMFSGKKIYIAGQDNKKLFESDPAKYLKSEATNTMEMNH